MVWLLAYIYGQRQMDKTLLVKWRLQMLKYFSSLSKTPIYPISYSTKSLKLSTHSQLKKKKGPKYGK